LSIDKNIQLYSNNAVLFADQYDSIDFSEVHKDWLEYIPKCGSALDVGSGSGRDARFLSQLGLSVFAIEPSPKLMRVAQANTLDQNITWLIDSLPHLGKHFPLDRQFDLILLSAVWMHFSREVRIASMNTLAGLLNDSGKLVITLRHGQFHDGRVTYGVSADEVENLAIQHGLKVIFVSKLSNDKIGRDKVKWQTLVLEK
jgi:SAM-dependent methyltransferase